MATIDELNRQLGEVRRDLRDLRDESRANFGSTAVAIRRTRQQVAQLELAQSVKKLAPPVSLLDWQPRLGEPAKPAIQDSLIDRLRKGEVVADTIGNVDPFIGQANMLPNPTLEAISGVVSTELVATPVGPAWNMWYESVSGADPGPLNDIFAEDLYPVGGADNPFNTQIVEVGIDGAGGGAQEVDAYFEPADPHGINYRPLPYLVAACRVMVYPGYTPPGWTVATVTMQIVDGATDAVLAESQELDMLTVDENGINRQLVAALQDDEAAFLAGSYRWRLKLHVEGNTADALSVLIGEPQMHMAFTPDAIPFSPQVARWVPELLESYSGGDIEPRVRVGGSSVLFGDGTNAPDTILYRDAADLLATDDEVSIKAAGGKDTLRLTSTAADTGITIGGDVNLYRSAADILKTDDRFDALSQSWTNLRGVIAIPYSSTAALPGTGTLDMPLADAGGTVAQMRLPFPGKVVGIALSLSSARTGGTLTARMFNNSSGGFVGPTATIDGTTTNNATGTASVGSAATGSPDIGSTNFFLMRLTTTGFTPTANTAKVVAYIALVAE